MCRRPPGHSFDTNFSCISGMGTYFTQLLKFFSFATNCSFSCVHWMKLSHPMAFSKSNLRSLICPSRATYWPLTSPSFTSFALTALIPFPQEKGIDTTTMLELKNLGELMHHCEAHGQAGSTTKLHTDLCCTKKPRIGTEGVLVTVSYASCVAVLCSVSPCKPWTCVPPSPNGWSPHRTNSIRASCWPQLAGRSTPSVIHGHSAICILCRSLMCVSHSYKF